jgi:acylphosphatase
VRNTREGTVEAVFEGDPQAVHELVEFCRDGPSGAEVASVDVMDEEPEGYPVSTFADLTRLRI